MYLIFPKQNLTSHKVGGFAAVFPLVTGEVILDLSLAKAVGSGPVCLEKVYSLLCVQNYIWF